MARGFLFQNKMTNTVYIFTDGSSNPKNKEGGWAFCVTDDPKSKTIIHKDSGYKEATTNNRMELTAVINALYYSYFNIDHLKELIIYSDSEYVSNPVYFGWLNDWRKSNWIKSDGSETKNSDLWEELYQLLKKYKFRKIKVDIRWVKGHNGHYFNEIVDKLAKKGRHNQKINSSYE